jgi:hypothetical protein
MPLPSLLGGKGSLTHGNIDLLGSQNVMPLHPQRSKIDLDGQLLHARL